MPATLKWHSQVKVDPNDPELQPDELEYKYKYLKPFIYENPTISTEMARQGLQSSSGWMREFVAHAITKPPPCVGLVAQFIEITLVTHTGMPRAVAEIITDYLYNPHMINVWNHDYVISRADCIVHNN